MWTASAVTIGAIVIETRPQKRITTRSVSCPRMKSMPWRISVSSGSRGRSIGARRSRRTNSRPRPDSMNDTASMARVGPGPIVDVRTPAMAGPRMNPTEYSASKYEFARPTCVRPTSAGTEAV